MSEQMGSDEEPVLDELLVAGHTEKTSEHIPTSEEIHEVFQRLIGEGKEYKVTKSIDDENGLYELEIEIPRELAGEITEYGYRRFSAPLAPEIHIAYYEHGDWVGGTSAARYVNGAWKIL